MNCKHREEIPDKPVEEFLEDHLGTFPIGTSERYSRLIPIITPGTTL